MPTFFSLPDQQIRRESSRVIEAMPALGAEKYIVL